MSYIKKQNKTTITKKKTKCKEKQKKEKERRKKRGLSGISQPASQALFVTTMPHETHCEKIDNVLLKALSLKLPQARPVRS